MQGIEMFIVLSLQLPLGLNFQNKKSLFTNVKVDGWRDL